MTIKGYAVKFDDPTFVKWGIFTFREDAERS